MAICLVGVRSLVMAVLLVWCCGCTSLHWQGVREASPPSGANPLPCRCAVITGMPKTPAHDGDQSGAIGQVLVLRNTHSAFKGWFPDLGDAAPDDGTHAELYLWPRVEEMTSVTKGGGFGGYTTTAAVSVTVLDSRRLPIMELRATGQSAMTYGEVLGSCVKSSCPCQKRFEELLSLMKQHGGYKPSWTGPSGVDLLPAQRVSEAIYSGMSDVARQAAEAPELAFVFRHLEFFRASPLEQMRLLGATATDATDKPGVCAVLLRYALRSGSDDMLGAFLSNGVAANTPAPDDGRYPLHVAAERGDTEAIARLLTAGADVNARDRSGRLPIFAAAWHDQAAAAFLLSDRRSEDDLADAAHPAASAVRLEALGQHHLQAGRSNRAVHCFQQAYEFQGKVLDDQRQVLNEIDLAESQAASSAVLNAALLGVVQDRLAAQAAAPHLQTMNAISGMQGGSLPPAYSTQVAVPALGSPGVWQTYQVGQDGAARVAGPAAAADRQGQAANPERALSPRALAEARLAGAAASRQRLLAAMVQVGGGRIPSIPAGQARAYIYRPTLGGNANVQVEMAGGTIATSPAPKGFTYLDGPPGRWTVRLGPGRKEALVLFLDQGETRYVRLNVVPGVVSVSVEPELVTNDVGDREMGLCKPADGAPR